MNLRHWSKTLRLSCWQVASSACQAQSSRQVCSVCQVPENWKRAAANPSRQCQTPETMRPPDYLLLLARLFQERMRPLRGNAMLKAPAAAYRDRTKTAERGARAAAGRVKPVLPPPVSASQSTVSVDDFMPPSP